MPIIRLVALIAILGLIWAGIITVFTKYGATVGLASLGFSVLVGHIISKRILAKIKSKKPIDRKGQER